MIVQYACNILKFKKWNILFLVILTILGLKLTTTVLTFRPRADQLFELHKCPACYGISACDYIRKVEISLDDISQFFSYFFGVKNVFFGIIEGKSRVVLKKLAHYAELEDFDETLPERSNYSHLFINNAAKRVVDLHELIKKEISLSFEKDHLSRLRLCPTTEHLDNLLRNVYLNNKHVDQEILLANIWTLVNINPEPLILQALPADDGWPVPKYFGSCGRIVLEEYAGLPLSDYYYASWQAKVKIAVSLLHAAFAFTFNHKDLSFYLTDVSSDNIVIDSNYTAKFVDLENIIVVSKNISNTVDFPKWEELHETVVNSNAPDQLTYSAEDICSHKISDHNFYAICQTLIAPNAVDTALPGGLLHDLPKRVYQQYPILKYLMKQCASPEEPYDRVHAGVQLKEQLNKILKNEK